MARTAAGELMIRHASTMDAELVAELLDQLGYPCTPEDARDRITEIAHDPDQLLLIGETDTAGVGLVCIDLMYYLPLGARTARITALVVEEGQRGRGFGVALIREAESQARAAGAARIELTSGDARQDAHRFYRRAGFQESASRFLKRLGGA